MSRREERRRAPRLRPERVHAFAVELHVRALARRPAEGEGVEMAARGYRFGGGAPAGREARARLEMPRAIIFDDGGGFWREDVPMGRLESDEPDQKGGYEGEGDAEDY